MTASLVTRHCFATGNCFYTSLHIAAQYGNVSAIELLLDRGASLDECDWNLFTPLECILSEYTPDGGNFREDLHDVDKECDAAVRLVQLGAATGIVQVWPFSMLFASTSNSAELFEILFEPRSACRKTETSLLDRTTIVSDESEWGDSFQDFLLPLQHVLPSPEEEDFGGKSVMHYAISFHGYSELPPQWNDALPRMTSFPWHHHWPSFPNMAFLTTSFKLYRRRLTHHTFERILNLQPERGISPLCRASARGILEIMENCLTMGAEIDFEGCILGSALMTACACGRLNAVKFLVRRGAAISYVGKGGTTSALAAGRRSKKVIAWLLVGRWTEQGRVDGGDSPLSGTDWCEEEFQPWSGIGKASLPLVGRRERQPHESSVDYAVRLSALKRRLRGTIIPLHSPNRFKR